MSAPLHDPLEPFRDEAELLLRSGLLAMGAGDVDPKLARAPEGKGDFAFACHPLAAKLRKAPPAMAAELASKLPPSELVTPRIEGPYLNFVMDDTTLARATLDAVLSGADAYGSLPSTGQRVIVEHTSANPTGPVHVGRARNPIIGDTLARILRAAGNQVATEYYVNDMGLQVITLTWGARTLRGKVQVETERDKPDHQLVAYYQKASELLERDPIVSKAIRELLHAYESGGDIAVQRSVRETVEHMLSGMRQSLERMGVRVDRFAWESQYVMTGEVQRVLERLKHSPRFREEEGAMYLDLEGLGIAGKSQKFFLARSDGTTLYPLRDVAYHLDKFRRADRLIDVLGEDHKLEARQLAIALQELGEPRAPEVVFYAFVKLPEGRMSTRKGTVVHMDDLLDEAEERALAEVRKRRGGELSEEQMQDIARAVGVGAVRFNIAAVQAEKGITFRWEEALDFEGASAPFVQYSHARAASILRKADAQGVAIPRTGLRVEVLTEPKEQALVRALARLPGVVRECAAEAKVHPMAGYALEVATAFNQFYRDSPVLQAEGEVRAARLGLVVASKQALRNSLDLLGLAAPESM